VEWSDRLRAKEAQRMEQLERAYEGREAERKARFQQVQEELARLEAQLRRSLGEVRGGWVPSRLVSSRLVVSRFAQSCARRCLCLRRCRR
jgi:predicted phage gp36 major capsid-like protein